MRPILIHTRPKPPKSLVLDGVDVIDLPLLSLHPFTIDKLTNHDKQAMLDFMAGAFDVVVVVSAEAVYGAMRFLQTHNIKHANQLCYQHPPIFVAVGQATKDTLARFGFCAITPKLMSNEGMLAMPEIAKLSNEHRVLIWRGVDGRRLLHNTLVSRGVDVKAIAWYERQVSDDLLNQYQQIITPLAQTHPIFVLITSQLSLQAWTTLPHQHDFIYLPLGDRLYHLTQEQFPNAHITKLDTLEPEHIHQAITTYQNEQF